METVEIDAAGQATTVVEDHDSLQSKAEISNNVSLRSSTEEEDKRLKICPFGPISSQSTIVDDSEEFPEPEDPLRKLDDYVEPRKESFLEQYKRQCQIYGVTPIGVVCEVLSVIEQDPSTPVEVDLNRYGSSNLQVQIALDVLASACPNVLEYLNLSFNLLMSETVACALSNMLQVAQKITILDLSHSTLNDQAVSQIAEAISTSNIQKMVLKNCYISDSAGAELFRKLISCEGLEELDLSWNRLEYQTGSSAALFLAENKILKELNLEGNFLYLGKECIVPFLRELSKNETLKKLNLAWNALGGELFSQWLPKAVLNSHVEVLNLQMNYGK
ncbi:LOW QUALITY PROTEIN: leucine-rich repeat-containing protein 74B-like [Uranotaenia lowii]|uniref:LOW QUALITY PROTEIN: leucine-rich repeat-containing protein 74B-like n=1 Tax=Uranotaenia lowii TaxID=190385 RepID=UPI0024784BEA|nr:LOW QUALITY PROTEIN: leucine-rich repeat-containing protein 74B-like [Uranotaenia lowii]